MLGRDKIDKSKVAVIVSMPTRSDDDNYRYPFNAAIWHSLEAELAKNKLYSEAWVYACPCRNTTDVTPSVERKCHYELIKYLKACECEYALLVGAKAMLIFSDGKQKAITKLRGSVLHVEGITAVPVYDYQDVLRDLELKDTFDADLAFFQRLVTNTFKEPKYRAFGRITQSDILINLLKQATCVTYDLETEGLNPRKGRVKMVGLAWKNNTTSTVYTGILYPEETPFDVPTIVKWKWSDIAKVLKVAQRTGAHNSKFDNGWLQSRGILAHTSMDTMLAAYCDNHMTPHTLKFLAKTILHAPYYEEGIDHDDLSDKMRDEMEKYCQLDCYFTLLLREHYKDNAFFYHIKGHTASYRKVLAKLLMPGTRVLEKIEARGVHVDKEELLRVQINLNEEKLIAKDKLLDLLLSDEIASDINFDSPTQLRKILYGKPSDGGFGYKPIYKERDPDDDDDPTTGKAALKKLAREGSEFCKVLLEYREYSKGLSSFVEPWLEMLDEKKRLYPSYRLTLATGRSACYNPNLQQVSRDKQIRNLIRPTPGWIFVEADFSQVELRVAAWIGRIHSMLKIYREGGDIHVNTAKAICRLSGMDWHLLSKEQKKEFRQKAKAVNFGFVYGMSADGFMDYADASYDVVLTKVEAEAYRKVYFGLYPELEDWHARSKRETKATGYVKNPFGFIRRLPNINSIDKKLVSKAIRCGYNTPVQGTAFYLTLLAMIDLEHDFSKYLDYVRIIGQCHDAIFTEINPKIGEKNIQTLLQHMHTVMINPRLHEFHLAMDVPLDVEIKYGKCWSDPDNKIFISS